MPKELKRKWHVAAGAGGEDMANTPAERAAQKSKGDAQVAKLDEEAASFMAANVKQLHVGGDGTKEIVVLGAGLVGSLCAVVLIRKGYKVHLYERYPDIRSIPSLGRSINLSITSRGMRAVKALGGTFYDDLLGLATKIRGRIIHTADGKTIFQRYGKDDTECNYSISRYELNKFLLETAGKEGANLYFDHAMSETSDFAGEHKMGCTLNFTCGPPNKPDLQTRCRVQVSCPVIDCSGGGSRVRYCLRHQGFLEFTEDLLTRGYKEVLFPKPEKGVDFGAKEGAGGEACPGGLGLHIWPRGDHMLMALSNRDGSFTGTIYMDSKGPEDSFEALEDKAKCEAFCKKHYPDAIPHVGGVDQLVKQVAENPNGILGTVVVSRWAIQAKAMLIGDSVHAMVPFFGQGCNCGFEDVFWLSKLLDKYCGDGKGKCAPEKCTPDNYEALFKELETVRKPNADAICAMALENFVEMRDKTADRKFQAMKKVENKLENAYPDRFRSRYAMVCYGGEGNVSYANAKFLGELQTTMLEKLCSHMTWPGNIDTDEGMQAEVEKVDMELASKMIDEILLPKQKELGIDLSTVRH